jgi:hypothetical protein
MSYLPQIQLRHRPDRLRDIIFIAVAVLLTALSIGSLTSQAAGHVTPREWTLTVLESGFEVSR